MVLVTTETTAKPSSRSVPILTPPSSSARTTATRTGFIPAPASGASARATASPATTAIGSATPTLNVLSLYTAQDAVEEGTVYNRITTNDNYPSGVYGRIPFYAVRAATIIDEFEEKVGRK